MEPPATPASAPQSRRPGRWLLAAGLAAFAAVLACYAVYHEIHPIKWTLDPVDLRVYRDGGMIVRHVQPLYNPHLAAPLYDWAGYGSLHLQFTYTPFAALMFAVVSVIPLRYLPDLAVLANITLMAATLWFSYGGLGMRRGAARLGATLLTAAAVLWTEPVFRTSYLGQINLALLALVVWDLCQPEHRTWKGAGVGIAAGIKLIPLIFIPYLLLTRKFRQAVVACATFAGTIVVGFIVLPADSAKWWFSGLFFNGGRAGFVGWAGNQSLQALIARLSGSVAAGKPFWLVAEVLAAIVGLGCAAVLDRAGHRMAAIVATGLTGLLMSPISWDHHWVWIVPGVAVAAWYAVAAMRARPAATGWLRSGWLRSALAWPACGFWLIAAGICLLFGAWPGSLWSEPKDLGPFSLGLIWAPPNTNPATYYKLGDKPWYAEYHWHGMELLTGNAFVLGGLAVLTVLVVAAVRILRGRGPVASVGEPAESAGQRPSLPQEAR